MHNPHESSGATHTIVFFAAIAATALVPLTSFPQQKDTPAGVETEEQRVLSAEDEYIAAEVKRDEAVLRRLVDDRFTNNSSRGTTAGKEDLIQAVLKMRMAGQTLRERSVLIEGDIALISARQTYVLLIQARRIVCRPCAIRLRT